MLSVAKCGYDNEYGNKYLSLHLPEDLSLLKSNEFLITVKGAEHCGELYYWLVSVPASLDTEATLFYESLHYLFTTGNVIEYLKRYESLLKLFLPTNDPNFIDSAHEFYNHYSKFDAIVPICEVMIRNYPIYCAKAWKECEREILPYAKSVESTFNQNGLSKKLEDITGESQETEFIATFCNSLNGGAEAIDISVNQHVFRIGSSHEWVVDFISHEYIIYLLKHALAGTSAFKELVKYWLYIEGLAEFYLSLTGKRSGFSECQHVIDFYNELYQGNNTLTAPELYNKAIDKFAIPKE